MKTTKKIFATLAVIILTIVLTWLCIEAASTASGNSVEERRSALFGGFMALALGCLSLIAVWVPWKKLFNRRNQ